MKKQITILLFTSIFLQVYSQDAIKTTGPCTDAMAQQSKGRWVKKADLGAMVSKETYNRLDKIHELFLKIYPEPTGVDAGWLRYTGMSYFGAKQIFKGKNDDPAYTNYSNLPDFLQFYYQVAFYPYTCDVYKKNILNPGYPGETGTFLNIMANIKLGELGTDNDTWTINGQPVVVWRPVLEENNGIEFSYSELDEKYFQVLIHRKGILPYKYVTRKQYLEYCIIHRKKFWNDVIKMMEQNPVRSVEEQEIEKKPHWRSFKNSLVMIPGN